MKSMTQQLITEQELIDSEQEYNLLDLFLKVANQQEELSEQICSFEISETVFENQSNSSQLLQQFSVIKKQNIVKNILKSFQRFIEDADIKEQETLLQIAEKSYSYCQLKKTIKRNFKTFGKRWNMKLKHLIEKCSNKSLFQFYLQNKSVEWLNLSKVKNKEDHMIVIDFLIAAIKTPEYSNKIKYYKKYKQSNTHN